MDLRNHGRSFWHEDHNYPLMASDVLETLDKLSLEKVHLLGHSMGGKVAMQFALSHPERVKKLIIADIAPVTYPPADYPPLKALLAVDLAVLEGRQQAMEIMSGYLDSTAVIDFLLTNLQRKKSGKYTWRFNLDALSKHFSEIKAWPERQGVFRGSTLFIKGSESEYLKEDHTRVITEMFPKVNLKVIAGAGHWLHSEKPRAFLKVVRDFLAE
jgi:esterase